MDIDPIDAAVLGEPVRVDLKAAPTSREEVDTSRICDQMVVHRELVLRAFAAAAGVPLVEEERIVPAGLSICPLDVLCLADNALLFEAALKEGGDEKTLTALSTALMSVVKDFPVRSEIAFPHSLIARRFRSSLKSAGFKELPADCRRPDRKRKRNRRRARSSVSSATSESSYRERSRSRDDPRDYRRRDRRSRSRSYRRRSPSPLLSRRDRRLAEDFIDHNRLDKRCAEIILNELTPRMLDRVLDRGFTVTGVNPSRDVMNRIKSAGARRERSRSRSYSRGRR